MSTLYDPRQRLNDHTHERWDHPGVFSDRPQPLRNRDYTQRAFTVGVGGPVGSGKTALMLALCRALRDRMNIAAVTNDIFTREDAEFLMRHDALDRSRIRGVETGGCPHAAIREDISANLLELEDLTTQHKPALLLLESGGDNLAAHFSRELADFTIYVIDVAGGDKVPRKGGPGITQSDLLVINKIDLAEAVGADLAVMERDAKKMRGEGPFVFAQVKQGGGVESIIGHILKAWTDATGGSQPAPFRVTPPVKPDAPHRKREAEDPATPPQRLAELMGDENFWVRRAARNHPNRPAEMLDLLVRAGGRPDLAGFGTPGDVTADELTQLAHGGGWARRLVARHPATPAPLLDLLARDEDPGLRRLVAEHPNTDAATLDRLLFDDDEPVRDAARAHPSSPHERVGLLIRAIKLDPLDEADVTHLLTRDGWARALVARNPQTAVNTLLELSRDTDPRVAAALAQNPATPPQVLLDLRQAKELHDALASHPAAPPELLAELSASTDVEVRMRVAAHSATPPDVLAALTEDGASGVREQVARNPSTPRCAIDRLVCAGSAPDLIGFASPQPDMTQDEIDALARGGIWARRLAARHPGTSQASLRRLANDPDFLVSDLASRRLPPS